MSQRIKLSNLREPLKHNWLTPIVLGLGGISYLHGPGSGLLWLIGLTAVSGASLILGQQTAFRVSPLILATCVLRYIGGMAGAWPLQFLLPILAALILIRIFTRLRPTEPFLAFGSLNKPATVAAILLGAIAVAALFAWRAVVDANLLADLPVERGSPFLLIAISAVGFAAINAIVEEIYFRGILQAAVSHGSDALHAPVLLQGLFFGLVHFAPSSIPHGLSGAILTAMFGIALGYFRLLSRGLAAPILAHLIADLGVFVVISAR